MGYDPKGNLTFAAGWTYSYDAQNRLTTMEGPGMTITLTYDPLNRVITRNVNGAVTQNVWDGWNLIEEHRPDWSIQRCYLQGANQNEMVAAFDGNVYSNHWFWQDGRGNTSHITGDPGNLLERYTYDLSGAPRFYDEWGGERGTSAYDTRFLFAGSQYLPDTGLYDMRNRFYHVALNRFLQTDPIGFQGDPLNLYRYANNDPVDFSDPMGLEGEIFGPGERELAVEVARHQIEAATSAPNRKSAIALFRQPGHANSRPVTYYPSKYVPVLRHGKGYKVGPTLDGELRYVKGIPMELEIPPDRFKGQVAVQPHSHNDKRDWNTKTPGIAVNRWSGQDLTLREVDRMDESTGKWYSRRNWKEVPSDLASRQKATRTSEAGNSSSSNAVTGSDTAPSAKDIDLAHQATGVPSLGAEAINFAPGPR